MSPEIEKHEYSGAGVLKATCEQCSEFKNAGGRPIRPDLWVYAGKGKQVERNEVEELIEAADLHESQTGHTVKVEIYK